MLNRFLLEHSDYDLKYEMRIADLTRVEKTKEDFYNKKEECYDYNEFIDYLYDNNAFLTKEDAEKILNEQNQQIIELNQFKEKVFQLIDEKISDENYKAEIIESNTNENFVMAYNRLIIAAFVELKEELEQ